MCSSRHGSRPAPGEHFQSDARPALSDESEDFGGASRQVDDDAFALRQLRRPAVQNPDGG